MAPKRQQDSEPSQRKLPSWPFESECDGIGTGEPMLRDHHGDASLDQGSASHSQFRATSQQAIPEYQIKLGDAFEWMAKREPNSIHAIVTDPPYSVKEYSEVEKTKLRQGRGGVWRIPPSFDGCQRGPLPRFTVLDETDRAALRSFFAEFAKRAMHVLTPGAHVLVATSPPALAFRLSTLDGSGV